MRTKNVDIAFYDMLKIHSVPYESFRENDFFREKCFHSDLRLDRRKLTFTDASDTEKQNKNNL